MCANKLVRFLMSFVAIALAVSPICARPEAFVREANTSLRFPSVPNQLEYRVQRAFTNVPVSAPVALATPPGETNRLFIVERVGRILVMTNLSQPSSTVFLDITDRVRSGGESGLLGLAFHPAYAENGYFYVFYTPRNADRLSRFEVSSENPSLALTNSEVVLINQFDRDGDHNAGDLHFGPDGYLYVSLGDEGCCDNTYGNAQIIDQNFFSAIMRIDVDQKPSNLPPNPHPASSTNYFVPADNPFVSGTKFFNRSVNPAKVRTEFFAVGFRNPWRFCIDEVTGNIFCGDVGQGTREEIDLVISGGNYGWPRWEGTKYSGFGEPGVTYLPPIFDYSRDLGGCVIGGGIYRGSRFPKLFGAYIFGDYLSGNIWALWKDEASPVRTEMLAINKGISAFGINPMNGELLICNVDENAVKHLVYTPPTDLRPVPSNLSAAGVFSDVANLTPAPGVVPYALNLPSFADTNLLVSRWFSLPDPTTKMVFQPQDSWLCPTGAVWIQHFELDTTNGLPESRRRIETRALVRTADGMYGLSYRWADSFTNADLVRLDGTNTAFKIYSRDGSTFRYLNWRYPSRDECLRCHTPESGWTLGFNAAQLNRNAILPGVSTNQIMAWQAAGYFANSVSNIHSLPALAAIQDESISREFRVRSYLAANCAGCHQPALPGSGLFDARLQTPTSAAGLIDGPLNNYRFNPENRVIKVGFPFQSQVYGRISRSQIHRPDFITGIDAAATNLLATWILQDLPARLSFSDWQIQQFGTVSDTTAQPQADPDGDGASNITEYITGTSPTNRAEVWSIRLSKNGEDLRLAFPRQANRAYQVQWTDDLVAGSWRPWDSPLNQLVFFAASSQAEFVLPQDESFTRFYRVVVTEP